MTTKEKAKAYDEAIERAKKCLDEKRDTCFVRPDVIFPELKESDDERIRKVLLNDFKNNCSEYYCEGVNRDMIIAWLEKQGEQEKLYAYIDKLASDTIYNDENGNPIDKDLMAFASKVAFSMIPATKTESYHDLNRSRISDAVIKGALWRREQSEQNPAWSEEDEARFESCIRVLQTSDGYDTLNAKWFKSLKDRVQLQNTWKPSDEQMEFLWKYAEQNNYDGSILTSLYNDLKKLKG